MDALLISSDLMTTSAASGAAERAGVSLESAVATDAVRQCEIQPRGLIAIDLTAPIASIDNLIRNLRQACPAAKILAFGPHVHTAKLEAARLAGCDQVISRGQFHKRFEELLRQCAADVD